MSVSSDGRSTLPPDDIRVPLLPQGQPPEGIPQDVRSEASNVSQAAGVTTTFVGAQATVPTSTASLSTEHVYTDGLAAADRKSEAAQMPETSFRPKGWTYQQLLDLFEGTGGKAIHPDKAEPLLLAKLQEVSLPPKALVGKPADQLTLLIETKDKALRKKILKQVSPEDAFVILKSIMHYKNIRELVPTDVQLEIEKYAFEKVVSQAWRALKPSDKANISSQAPAWASTAERELESKEAQVRSPAAISSAAAAVAGTVLADQQREVKRARGDVPVAEAPDIINATVIPAEERAPGGILDRIGSAVIHFITEIGKTLGFLKIVDFLVNHIRGDVKVLKNGKTEYLTRNEAIKMGYNHMLATMPLLRAADGKIVPMRSNTVLSAGGDSIKLVESVAARKLLAVQHMVHDSIKLQLARRVFIDKVAEQIADSEDEPPPYGERYIKARADLEKKLSIEVFKGKEESLIETTNDFLDLDIHDFETDIDVKKIWTKVSEETGVQHKLTGTYRALSDNEVFSELASLKSIDPKYQRDYRELLSEELKNFDCRPKGQRYNELMRFIADKPIYSTVKSHYEEPKVAEKPGPRGVAGQIADEMEYYFLGTEKTSTPTPERVKPVKPKKTAEAEAAEKIAIKMGQATGIHAYIAERVASFVTGNQTLEGDAGFLKLLSGEEEIKGASAAKWPGTDEARFVKERELRMAKRRNVAENNRIQQEQRAKLEAFQYGGVRLGNFVYPKDVTLHQFHEFILDDYKTKLAEAIKKSQSGNIEGSIADAKALREYSGHIHAYLERELGRAKDVNEKRYIMTMIKVFDEQNLLLTEVPVRGFSRLYVADVGHVFADAAALGKSFLAEQPRLAEMIEKRTVDQQKSKLKDDEANRKGGGAAPPAPGRVYAEGDDKKFGAAHGEGPAPAPRPADQEPPRGPTPTETPGG